MLQEWADIIDAWVGGQMHAPALYPASMSILTPEARTGLIGELSRSGDPYFNGLGALAHGYSMASHVQHVDMVGASIALERDRRSVEHRESIHLAHEGRLLSDLLDFLFLRIGVGYRFVAADLYQLADIRAATDEARAPFRQAAEGWLRIEYPDMPPRAP
jgi:hypothetical protein